MNTLSWLFLCFFLSDFHVDESLSLDPKTQRTALSATVRVLNVDANTVGSGVIVAKVGPVVYYLTAAHVVAGADRVEVHHFDGKTFPKPSIIQRGAEVVAFGNSSGEDLALVRAKATDLAVASVPLAKKKGKPVGTNFTGYSLGCASGEAPTLLDESISGVALLRKNADLPLHRFFETKKIPVKGRSGGALIQADGSLIGICSGHRGRVGYYTHIDEVRRFLSANGLGYLTRD